MIDRVSLSRCLLLVALTLIGAWLRFSAIGFGLPDRFRPDEEMTVPTALNFEHDFNPHLAIYPAAQTYLVHGVLRSYAALVGAGSDWRAMYGTENDARAFRIARKITAAMSTVTIPVMYYAAAPVFGPRAAMASAAIVTFAFLHVRESKSAKVEVPAGFWLALCMAMMLRIPVRGRLTWYLLAGLFCGLAAATHYTSGAIAVGILVAHIEARIKEGKALRTSLFDARIILAGVVTILVFLCADPYFALDWKQTTNDFHFMRYVYTDWIGGKSPAGDGWRWLFLRAMPASFGTGLEIFMLGALLWVVFRPKPGTLALLAFVAVSFFSLLGGHPQLEYRYLINPLLAMAILGGVLADDLMSLGRGLLGPHMRFVAGVLAVLLLTPSFVRDLQLNHLLHQVDTRTIAKLWIFDNIPSGSSIALIDGDGYGKPKLAGRYNLINVNGTSPASLYDAIKTAKWVISDSFPPLVLWSRGANEMELNELDSRGKLVLDVASIRPDAELPTCDPNDAFYVPFDGIDTMIRPGPRVRIWKIGKVSHFSADSIEGAQTGAIDRQGTADRTNPKLDQALGRRQVDRLPNR